MRRSRLVALVALLALLAGCSRVQRGSEERACASACAALAGSGCSAEARDTCSSGCRSERATARNAECLEAYDRFLSCVSQGANTCERNPGEALTRGLGIARCESEHARYARCAEACHERGVVRTGSRALPSGGKEAQVMAEVTTRGCGERLRSGRRGAGAGARCEHPSVCDAVDCSCPSASEGYRVRACVDFRCAEPNVACRLAPSAVGHRVCRP
jgi:hypothetical protein